MADTQAIATLVGRDQASEPFSKVAPVLAGIERQGALTSNSMVGLAQSFTGLNAASLGIIGIGVAVAAGLGKAVSAATQLQQTVANVKSIKPEIDATGVFDSLNAMQTRVAQSSDQLGKSLYNVFSSIDVSQAEGLALVEKFGRGAVAAQTDAETFGTSVIGVMNAYKLSVADTDHIQDVFFNTVKNGVVTGSELAGNLGLVTQSAKLAGVNIDELGALIAGVTKESGPASQNINNLNNLLLKLNTPEATKQFNALGIATVDAAGNMRPVIDVMTDLKAKTDGMTESAKLAAIQKIFPDLQARAGAATIMSQLDNVNKFLDENRNHVGAANEAYETMSNTVQAKMQIIGQTINSAFTAIGGKILQLVQPVVSAIADNLAPALSNIGSIIEAVLGPAAAKLGELFGEIGREAGLVGTQLQNAFGQLQLGDFGGAFSTILHSLDELRVQMFGAGGELINSLANGMLQGANDLLTNVADQIAGFIAGFFIGNSPPPTGPLSQIQQGGANTMNAYVVGLGEGTSGVEEVAGRVNTALALANGNQGISAAKANMAGLKAAVEETDDAIRGLNSQIRDIDSASKQVQFTIKDVEQKYKDQLAPLKDASAELKNQNDLASKQLDIQDRIRNLEFRRAMDQAKGDPVLRAQYKGQLDALSAQEEELNLRKSVRDLDEQQQALEKKRAEAKKNGKDFNEKDFTLEQEKIELNRRQLELKQKLNGMVDKQAVAQLTVQKAVADEETAQRKIGEDQAKLDRETQLAGIEGQIQAITKAQEEETAPLRAQLELYGRQKEALNEIRGALQAQKADLQDAIQPLEAAKKATGAGASKTVTPLATAGVNAPRPLGGAAANPAASFAATIGPAVEKAATTAGETMGQRFVGGFQAWIAANGVNLVGIGLGAALLAPLGPVGVLLGGVLGEKVIEGLKARIPNMGQQISDAFATIGQALQGDWSPDESIDPVINKLGMAATKIREFGQNIQDAIATVRQVFQGEWAPDDSIDPMVNAIGKLAIVVRDQVLPAIQGGFARIQQIISQATPILTTAFTAIRSAAAAALTWIQTQWDKFGPSIIASTERLAGWLADQWNKIQAAVQRFLGLVQSAWDSHGKEILDLLGNTWILIQAVVGSAIEIVFGLITAGLQLITGDWSGAWTTIQTMVSDVWTTITTVIIPTALTIIQQAMFMTWSQLIIDIQTQWAVIGTALNAAWTLITTTLTAWLGTGQGEDNQGGTGIIGAISGAWATINAAIPAAWEAIKLAIAGKLGEILGGFTLWAGQVIGALQQLAKDALEEAGSIGKSIVEGIINAVNEAKDKLGEALTNLVKGAIKKATDALGLDQDIGEVTHVGRRIIDEIIVGAQSKAKELGGVLQRIIGGATSGVGISGGVPVNLPGAVTDWVSQAMQITGTPPEWLQAILAIVQNESSGRPDAWNPEPVMLNGVAYHATGLMQTIPPTFASYALPGHGNILNPIDNAVAAIRYINARYGGDFWRAYRASISGGYDEGGWLQPGITIARNDTGRPEPILTADQWDRLLDNRQQAPTFQVTLIGPDPDEMLDRLKVWVDQQEVLYGKRGL